MPIKNKSVVLNILSILGIFILALTIRISYFHNTQIDQPIRGDAFNYVQYAFNLTNFGTFSKDTNTDTPQPDAYWSPGYPLYIASLMQLEKLTGLDTYRSIIYGQALLGSLTAVLAFLLGRLYLPLGYAVAAGLLTCYSPHLISLGNYVLTESLFSFVLLAAVYSFGCAYKRFSRSFFLYSGFLFGFGYLVNPVSFFSFILLVALAILKLRHNHSKVILLKTFLPSVITFITIFGAWEIRNNVNLSNEAPNSSTRLFTNLVIGTHHDYHETWRANPRDPNNPAQLDLNQLDYSYSKFSIDFFKKIQQDPTHYLNWYLIKKPLQLWGWDIQVGYGDIYVYIVNFSLYHVSKYAIFTYSIMYSTHYWLFGFALLGLIFIIRDYKSEEKDTFVIQSIYCVLIYISGVYIVTQADGRYSIPLRPEMYLASMYFIHHLSKYWPQKT